MQKTNAVILEFQDLLRLEGFFQEMFKLSGMEPTVIMEEDAFDSLFEEDATTHAVMTRVELLLGIIISYED